MTFTSNHYRLAACMMTGDMVDVSTPFVTVVSGGAEVCMRTMGWWFVPDTEVAQLITAGAMPEVWA